MFAAVIHGSPLPRGPWELARDADGRNLLHVANMMGRQDSAWKLLKACPQLAAMPDYQLKLPEDVASNEIIKSLCTKARQKVYVQHEAL